MIPRRFSGFRPSENPIVGYRRMLRMPIAHRTSTTRLSGLWSKPTSAPLSFPARLLRQIVARGSGLLKLRPIVATVLQRPRKSKS